VDYVFRLPKNAVVCCDRAPAEVAAQVPADQAGVTPVPISAAGHSSWDRTRRVGKAEYLARREPRFIVLAHRPSTPPGRCTKNCTAPGDMKTASGQQLDLRDHQHPYSGPTSCAVVSSVAYMLLGELRHLGLKGTELEQAVLHHPQSCSNQRAGLCQRPPGLAPPRLRLPIQGAAREHPRQPQARLPTAPGVGHSRRLDKPSQVPTPARGMCGLRLLSAPAPKSRGDPGRQPAGYAAPSLTTGSPPRSLAVDIQAKRAGSSP
jgi:hypothetical protein